MGDPSEAGETSSNVDPPGVQGVARRSERRNPDGAGAKALVLTLEAVIAARAASSGVGRTTSARIEGRLQKSVRRIFPAKSRWTARRTKAEQGRGAQRLFPDKESRRAFLERVLSSERDFE